VRAFELKLVKQIVVASTSGNGSPTPGAGYAHDAFVRVEQVEYKTGIKAKLRIHVQTQEGPKEKTITVKNGADLYALSNERAKIPCQRRQTQYPTSSPAIFSDASRITPFRNPNMGHRSSRSKTGGRIG
jgi:hypothetical protein